MGPTKSPKFKDEKSKEEEGMISMDAKRKLWCLLTKTEMGSEEAETATLTPTKMGVQLLKLTKDGDYLMYSDFAKLMKA